MDSRYLDRTDFKAASIGLTSKQLSFQILKFFISVSLLPFTMPRPKKSHDDVRKMVCYKCGGKAKSNEVMGPSGRQLLQQALQALFSSPPDDDAQYWTHHWEHEKHPSMLCGTCRTHLRRLRDAQFLDPDGKWSDFVEHEEVPVPHSQDGKPVCKMCQVVRSGGPHTKNPYGAKTPYAKTKAP